MEEGELECLLVWARCFTMSIKKQKMKRMSIENSCSSKGNKPCGECYSSKSGVSHLWRFITVRQVLPGLNFTPLCYEILPLSNKPHVWKVLSTLSLHAESNCPQLNLINQFTVNTGVGWREAFHFHLTGKCLEINQILS